MILSTFKASGFALRQLPKATIRILAITNSSHRTTVSPPPPNQYIPYSRPPVPGSQPPQGSPENQRTPRPQSTYEALRPPSQAANSNNNDNHYNQRPVSYAPGLNTNIENPQELATSVYDSPIASHNPQSAGTYTSSGYSPDDPSAPPPLGPSAPSYAAPSVPDSMLPGGGAPGTAPQPLQPSGPAYDSRQGLPSQSGGGGGAAGYKPYVPPSSAY